MRVLDRLAATRIVALPDAIDAAVWPEGAIVLRFAADEALVIADVPSSALADPHAIVERETGYVAIWLPHAEAVDVLARECDWELPRSMGPWGNGFVADRPACAQGMVAGLPVKLWFEHDRVLFVAASPFAAELAERLR